MDNRSIPDYSHDFLLNQLRKLGYRFDVEGVCYVLTQQGINAFLLGEKEFDYFSDRLDFIAQSPDLYEQVNQTIEKIKKRGDGNLSEQEQAIVDIKVSFDQFVIFQLPYNFEEFFGGKAVQQLQAIDYVYANNWKLFRDEIEKPDPQNMFSGIYTKEELQKYLEKLDTLLLQEAAPDRFVMELQNINHTMALTHDKTNGWMMIDASKLPPKKQIIPKEKLAEELFEALGTRCGEINSKYIVFHTTIRSNKQNSEKNRDLLKKLKESPEFQPPHRITDELAKRQTSTLGISLTHIAAKYADHAALESLLKIKPIKVADIKNKINSTPLHIVAEVGRPEVIEKLYQGGANLYARNVNGKTPFDEAVEKGNTDNIKAFVKIDPDFLKKIRWDLVEKAVLNNRFEMLKYLLEQIPSFNEEEMDFIDSFLIQAVQFKNVEMAKMLLSRGADPNMENEWGTTLLCLTIAHKNTEMIKALLDKGANPDQQEDDWGLTPLHIAVSSKEPEIILALLDKGADPYKPDNDGSTPINLADKDMAATIRMHMSKIIARENQVNASENKSSYFQKKNIKNKTNDISSPGKYPKK